MKPMRNILPFNTQRSHINVKSTHTLCTPLHFDMQCTPLTHSLPVKGVPTMNENVIQCELRTHMKNECRNTTQYYEALTGVNASRLSKMLSGAVILKFDEAFTLLSFLHDSSITALEILCCISSYSHEAARRLNKVRNGPEKELAAYLTTPRSVDEVKKQRGTWAFEALRRVGNLMMSVSNV